MTVHSLFPGFIKMNYTNTVSSVPRAHVMTLPCSPVLDVGSGDWHVNLKGGGTMLWVTALQDLVTTFQPFYNTAATAFGFADLYTMDDEDADPQWRDGFAVAAPGSGGGSNVSCGEAVHTFRTLEGGIFRLYLMESNVANDTLTGPPYASNLALLVNQMTEDDTGFVIGRDGAFLISLIRRVAKENDALRKKYILNT